MKTLLELADDYAKAYFTGRGEEARKLLQAAVINAEVASLSTEKMVISRFDEERLPTFKQGAPSHELEGLMTAESCTWLVKELDSLRSAVKAAYGHLWHVNNEPLAPIPLRSPEKAAHEARKLLRDKLSSEERGEGIEAVRILLEVPTTSDQLRDEYRSGLDSPDNTPEEEE